MWAVVLVVFDDSLTTYISLAKIFFFHSYDSHMTCLNSTMHVLLLLVVT